MQVFKKLWYWYWYPGCFHTSRVVNLECEVDFILFQVLHVASLIMMTAH